MAELILTSLCGFGVGVVVGMFLIFWGIAMLMEQGKLAKTEKWKE